MPRGKRSAPVAPMRLRLCWLHGTACRWAGGDGTLEHEVGDLSVAAYEVSRQVYPDTLPGRTHAEVRERAVQRHGSDCRQATERDRTQQVGIFSTYVHPRDEELEALSRQAKERGRHDAG